MAEGDDADVKIVFLTMHDEPEYVTRALRAGASGYILKSSASSELFEAIPQVLEGRIFVSPLVAGVVADSLRDELTPRELTDRQREVLRLLAGGHSMKEAATILGVTPRTVAFHKYGMMERLGIRSTAELVRYAVQRGLVKDRREAPAPGPARPSRRLPQLAQVGPHPGITAGDVPRTSVVAHFGRALDASGRDRMEYSHRRLCLLTGRPRKTCNF